MYSVGILDLKNKLSRYLDYAKQGQSIIITERGKPIAVLHPIGNGEGLSSTEIDLARLSAEGCLRLRGVGASKKFPPVKVTGSSVSDAIIEDRR